MKEMRKEKERQLLRLPAVSLVVDLAMALCNLFLFL